jgi:hypothetical protein
MQRLVLAVPFFNQFHQTRKHAFLLHHLERFFIRTSIVKENGGYEVECGRVIFL